MNIQDIPSDLLLKIKQQFDSDPQVTRLRIRQRTMLERGDYPGAMGLGKAIEGLYARVVENYMREAEEQVDKVDFDRIDIPAEAKERILMLAVSMFMATDIIESAIMDIDDIFRKYDRELRFEMFNDIRQLSQMAKGKLKFLQENSDYMKDLIWADKCDDMYEIIQSKARSIIRKRKEDPKWGKNMERMRNGNN